MFNSLPNPGHFTQNPSQSSSEVPERSQISSEFQWNLLDIFSNEEDFEKSLASLKSFPDKLKSFEGKISQSAENLLTFFKLREEALGIYEKVISYARLHRDEDSRVGKYQAFTAQAHNLGSEIMQAASWFAPELLSIPWNTVDELLSENQELAVYRHYLEDEFRVREHVLSPESEYVLALSANFSGGPANIFHAFNDADIGPLFPVIKDDEGNEIQLSPARYSAILETGSPEMRKDAFEGLFLTYKQFSNTLASSLKTQIDRDVFYARARKYDDSLQAALSGDNVPQAVYLNLIETIHKNLPRVHKYLKVRKKALQLDELHIYDLHCPMFPLVTEKYPYRKAQRAVLDALAPLNHGYVEDAENVFTSNWIDVYENKGKYNGAYSWGSYKTHPYILLNYSDTLNDVFTTAHELGHTMHSFYTAKHQPYIYGDYSIFVAEVASTMNEALLMDHLLKNTDDRLKKLNLLGQYLSNINGTVIAQTLFAEFELKIHQMAEEGKPLTQDTLSEEYFKLLQTYWGEVLTYDELYRYTWSRIPHFYANFYVYKYATSFAASTALSRKIIDDETGAADRYQQFLSSGSSDYPIELLKKAGVDMSAPAPIDATMDLYEELVEEMEGLLGE